jgi:hypothetical protein
VITVDEINRRRHACLRCRGSFKIAGPFTASLRRKLAVMLDQSQPVMAIRTIREETGAGLVEAKATYQHLTLAARKCHWCGSRIPAEDYIDCPACRALNIDVRSTRRDV